MGNFSYGQEPHLLHYLPIYVLVKFFPDQKQLIIALSFSGSYYFKNFMSKK